MKTENITTPRQIEDLYRSALYNLDSILDRRDLNAANAFGETPAQIKRDIEDLFECGECLYDFGLFWGAIVPLDTKTVIKTHLASPIALILALGLYGSGLELSNYTEGKVTSLQFAHFSAKMAELRKMDLVVYDCREANVNLDIDGREDVLVKLF